VERLPSIGGGRRASRAGKEAPVASPRRRLFLAGCAALTLAVLVVAAIAVVRHDPVGGDTPRPPVGVPQDRPGPVLLIPGYGGERAGLLVLASRLSAAGRQVHVLTLPGRGEGDLHLQAMTLDRAVRAAMAGGAPSVDVVGYSAGGVVARLWAREDGGAARARRIVTLGSPHHGTDLAELGALLGAKACPVACRQLRPGSALLARLAAGDETPAGPRWTSIWTRDDRVVTPPGSARLSGALDIAVQQVCRHRVVAHGQLPVDPVVTGLVLRSVGVGPPRALRPGDCVRLARLGSGHP
jgi:triacylglycerol esterase/lipase EstA (alpha/beta hydrolase family)